MLTAGTYTAFEFFQNFLYFWTFGSRFEVGRIPLKIKHKIKYWYHEMYIFEHVKFFFPPWMHPRLKIDIKEKINCRLVVWRMQNLETTAMFTCIKTKFQLPEYILRWENLLFFFYVKRKSWFWSINIVRHEKGSEQGNGEFCTCMYELYTFY